MSLGVIDHLKIIHIQHEKKCIGITVLNCFAALFFKGNVIVDSGKRIDFCFQAHFLGIHLFLVDGCKPPCNPGDLLVLTCHTYQVQAVPLQVLSAQCTTDIHDHVGCLFQTFLECFAVRILVLLRYKCISEDIALHIILVFLFQYKLPIDHIVDADRVVYDLILQNFLMILFRDHLEQLILRHQFMLSCADTLLSLPHLYLFSPYRYLMYSALQNLRYYLCQICKSPDCRHRIINRSKAV